LREWSETDHHFAPPQPIAGPFLLRAESQHSGFRYFDADGGELSVGPVGVEVARVARLRVTMLMLDHSLQSGGNGVRRDSLDIALQRHGGP